MMICHTRQVLLRFNKSSYYPRTIVLLYIILTTAIALTAVMLPVGNITYEGNIAGIPDRILPCNSTVRTEVTSEANRILLCK